MEIEMNLPKTQKGRVLKYFRTRPFYAVTFSICRVPLPLTPLQLMRQLDGYLQM